MHWQTTLNGSLVSTLQQTPCGIVTKNCRSPSEPHLSEFHSELAIQGQIGSLVGQIPMSSETNSADVTIGISQFVIANSRHVLPKYNATPLDKLLHGFVKGVVESLDKMRLSNQKYILPH